eukprot:TRINITY_DN1120_c0_g1_i1.p1 TRINITY_DN1120_c0_g1~~TRINITY_DN1120_c0_g1_i1.p1  ORF type:complete len:299 (+),score=45.72 TRINITY_DN1120_c0_g1_i1:245-1141(+)
MGLLLGWSTSTPTLWQHQSPLSSSRRQGSSVHAESTISLDSVHIARLGDMFRLLVACNSLEHTCSRGFREVWHANMTSCICDAVPPQLCFKGDAGRALADDIRIWRSFATLVKPPRGPLLADVVCGLVWGIFAQAVGTGTPSCAAHSQALELLCHLKNVKAADDSTPQQGSPYAEDYLKVIFKALVAQVVKAAGGAEAKPEDGEPKADRKTGKSNRKTKGSEAKGGGTDPNSEEFKVELQKLWHAENMAHTRSAYAKVCTSWPLWRSMLPAALSDAVQEAAADNGKKATLAPAVQTGA